jgi:hypothetical protein
MHTEFIRRTWKKKPVGRSRYRRECLSVEICTPVFCWVKVRGLEMVSELTRGCDSWRLKNNNTHHESSQYVTLTFQFYARMALRYAWNQLYAMSNHCSFEDLRIQRNVYKFSLFRFSFSVTVHATGKWFLRSVCCACHEGRWHELKRGPKSGIKKIR